MSLEDVKAVIGEFSFDHVGIAVKSIEEASGFYKTLGFSSYSVEEVAREKVKVALFQLANQSRIELLEATSEDSPVARFISKRGTGIHHICLRVLNLKQKLQDLKASGIKLINETPQKGAHNCLVAFVHPHSTGGVLLELSEPEVI